MSSQKIEPRLVSEMDRLRHAATSERLPVLIEHTEAAHVPADGDLADVEQTVRAQQREVVTCLESLGVSGGIEQLVLANALAAELTPQQIEAVADLDAVKVVRLNRPEQVTC